MSDLNQAYCCKVLIINTVSYVKLISYCKSCDLHVVNKVSE